MLPPGGRKSSPFLEVNSLRKFFPVQRSLVAQVFSRTAADTVHAVDGVTFNVERGDVFGLVGESGSGKTTTGRVTAGLVTPTEGHVTFDGVEIFSMGKSELRKLRKRIQLVYQDPLSSLNPKMTIGDAVSEPLRYLSDEPALKSREHVSELLERVGLFPADSFYFRYPHQLSGGQRQRVVIARALSIGPEYLVADEPVAMVDVSVRAQIMDLLLTMQRELNLTILLITHDLAVAKYMCNKIAVMYLGKIMEYARTEDLFRNPLHPYTQALLAAVPIPDPKKRSVKKIPSGEIPSALNPPTGCVFHPRCPRVFGKCSAEVPPLLEHETGHYVACHLYS
jgi:peptide/nickel transport system ATP-binding protein